MNAFLESPWPALVLGVMAGVVADRHGDRRLFLVSLVLLTTAGFLGLHALATPGIVLDQWFCNM